MIDISYVNKELKKDRAGFIKKTEDLYTGKLKEVVDWIIKTHSPIVLLSGPSSSGKTTTAKLLAKYLEDKNIRASVVSLDDFYLDRDEVPLNSDGYRDLETIHSLDINKIHESLKELLAEGFSQFPLFDFITERRKVETRKIEHGENHVLIIEGIHALNPIITDFSINGELNITKVYISVEDGFSLENGKVVTNNQVRFIRRLVRDFHYRDAPVRLTFGMWKAVREGEKKHIDPFMNLANFKINTVIDYGPGIFKKYLDYFLKNTEENNKNYQQLLKYSSLYSEFETVSREEIPKNSLLHEFLWEDIEKNNAMWYNKLE